MNLEENTFQIVLGMNSQPAVYVAAGVGKHVYMSLLASSQT